MEAEGTQSLCEILLLKNSLYLNFIIFKMRAKIPNFSHLWVKWNNKMSALHIGGAQ